MNVNSVIKTAVASLLVAGCAFTFAACGGTETTNTAETNGNTSQTNASSQSITKPERNPEVLVDTENPIGYQLQSPKEGDTIAVLHTNMGDITMRFFPEAAPKAVDNFIRLAESGKYNNTIFHRVMNDFMIQGGDYENGDGTGGKSADGGSFEDEFSTSLYNIRGSVAMANSGVNTNGSQFFINQAGPSSFSRDNIQSYEEVYASAESAYNQYVEEAGEEFVNSFPTVEDFIEYCGGISPLDYLVTEDVYKLYEANGGNIHLDGALRASGGHTVFGQVIEGMDVVDAIAAVEVDEETNKPNTDVVITSVEIKEYKAQ